MGKYQKGASMSSSVMPARMFKVRHLLHSVKGANSSDGTVLFCDTCGIVNRTPEQDAGSSRNFGSLEQWKVFHEGHGTVGLLPGGTFEYQCSCGGAW